MTFPNATAEIESDFIPPVERMSRDIAKSAEKLTDTEARYLVDYYYICQEDRKRSANQTRALTEGGEPCLVVSWLAAQSNTLESQIKRALDKYTDAHPVGEWLKSIYGIGPVIAAGLLAHIDIEKAPTAGHIWSYAGLNPKAKWEKGEKIREWVNKHEHLTPEGLYMSASMEFGRNPTLLRKCVETDEEGNHVKFTKTNLINALIRRPWNASLKVLCWKAGQSFMKFSNAEECDYGRIYKERKVLELERNDNGTNRELAHASASKVGKSTDAYGHYSSGVLPPAQIDARARRYAVKLFLAHLHEVWYIKHYNKAPPLPYPIAILGHAHKIDPFNPINPIKA